MEVEEENEILFPDVLVKKGKDATLVHTISRKAIHTNRNLNTEWRTVQIRSKNICSKSLELGGTEHIAKETEIIRKVLSTKQSKINVKKHDNTRTTHEHKENIFAIHQGHHRYN